jgi:hypothetical protein
LIGAGRGGGTSASGGGFYQDETSEVAGTAGLTQDWSLSSARDCKTLLLVLWWNKMEGTAAGNFPHNGSQMQANRPHCDQCGQPPRKGYWPFGGERVTQSELGSAMQPPDSLLPVRNGCTLSNLRNRCHYRLNPETSERVYSRTWDVLVAAGTCRRVSVRRCSCACCEDAIR